MTSGSSRSAAAQQQDRMRWTLDDDPLSPEDRHLKGGEPDLDAVYRSHASRLTRYIWRRTGNRDDALDLVQEAFARVLRLGWGRSRAIDRPEAYLTRAA